MMGFAPLHRYQAVAAALRMRAALRLQERWPREQIERYQRRRITQLVEYARQHSPYYKALYQGIARGEARLEALPVVTKAQMMEHFDAFVTERRLRLADVERHLQRLQGDELYQGELRILASSGSTGGRGIYVFDRAEWLQVLAGALRWTEFMGVKPTLPRRTRMALIAAPDAKHMTHRGSLSVDVGLFKTLRLSATKRCPSAPA
jgi:phenylacetate-coenzyme A ligase PaaK-like adenylate-forming protein